MTKTETLKAVQAALISEIEVAFIQRTDSPAAHALWTYKVGLLDQVTTDLRAA